MERLTKRQVQEIIGQYLRIDPANLLSVFTVSEEITLPLLVLESMGYITIEKWDNLPFSTISLVDGLLDD